MGLQQFNDIINLFLVKQEFSSDASFEKSWSIEPYTITRAQIDFFHRFPQYRIQWNFIFGNSNHSHFQLTLSIAISSQVISFTIYPWYVKQGLKTCGKSKEKKLFCDTVFSVISICATDWNYGEAVVKYFTFSFFYTSYWPSSRSALQVTDRFCGTDWNHGEVVVKYFTFSFFYTSYWPSSRSVLQVTDRFCGTDWNHGEVVVKDFTFSFFYTYYWSSSRSVLQVTDRFLPCRFMAKGEVRGPY